MAIPEDLKGQRFGRLVALELIHKNNKTAWLCQCDCGNTKVVSSLNLKKGTQSCGCIKSPSLAGKVFGKLTVLKLSEKPRKGKQSKLWICLCECGGMREVLTDSLNLGIVTSCGCHSNIKDITGVRSGSLVAKRLAYKKNRDAYWHCDCDCGGTKIVKSADISSNSIVSCGCRAHKQAEDLVGQQFGRLLVSSYSHKVGRKRYWVCQCNCGNVVTVSGPCLKSGNTVSCGCYNRDRVKELTTKHGMAATRVYKQWQGIKSRCLNPKSTGYHNYGGRGITVCDRWKDSFENFYKDMGDPPTNEYEIDRIDVNGNYEPGNVRWVTPKENVRNKRDTVYITYNDLTFSLPEWADRMLVKNSLLAGRRKRGWSDVEIISVPIGMRLKDYYDINKNY